MVKILFVIIFFFPIVVVMGQNYVRVDSIVRQYKGAYSNPIKLALQINDDFESDSDKARAIYTWMSTNIKYDYKKYTSKKKYIKFKYKTYEQKREKLRKLDSQKTLSTIKKEKGISSDYSILFQRLCGYTGLKSEVILGTSKTEKKLIGKKPGKVDHSWNAVKIDSKWHLVDVTWGAGHVDPKTEEFVFCFDDFYFCTPPEKFFLNHFPKDSTFLFTNKSKNDFTNLPLYTCDFVKSDISITPNNGVINFHENEELSFEVNSLQSIDQVSYRFNNEKLITKELATIDSDIGEFKVLSPNKNICYLTIYLNSVSMVTYKLIKTK